MKWYVYLWKLPNGKPVYIGKGKGARAFWPMNRDERHNKELSKVVETLVLCGMYPIFEVRFVRDEIEAFKLEEVLITEYKLARLLTNTTHNDIGFEWRSFFREIGQMEKPAVKPYSPYLVERMTTQPWENDEKTGVL